ncbi:methionine--tRNA ligase [Candidatus Woesearchaeota archaeon]|nr:methionine--tRNA ligase [Candidatus Woesearchaeota archaeon]
MKTLITSALLYANGDVHIGHLVEYIQTDIYSRFLKLIGEDAIYICASDMHGTPIEVNAQKAGIKPEEFANKFHKKNLAAFKKFLINFDNYYTTHSKENEELSNYFFDKMQKKGHIVKKKVEVIYCEKCQRDLPDRFVRGTCPQCGTASQYGDVCESCGITLKGTDLLDPKCSICGETPVTKDAEHYFFRLSNFTKKLTDWLNQNKNLQPEIKKHIFGWIEKGLEDWCISRSGPYFGFKIPGEKNLFFYVWLDAPIGYVSSTKNYTEKWRDYWQDKSRIIHVIGKDIIYFHFLFWPAMLMAVDFTLPDDIVVHGFLTVNSQKMSKSRGTFFTAEEFARLYNPEYLRFYYAKGLSKKMADLDLNFEDFKDTINNELVANIGNFTYRTLSFIDKNYGGKIEKIEQDQEFTKKVEHLIEHIKKSYQEFNFKEAVKNIMEISSLGNAYFQKNEPWKNKEQAQPIVGLCANLVRNISILIKPILPNISKEIEKQFKEKDLQWKDIDFKQKIKLGETKILINKIENLPHRLKFPLTLKVAKITGVKDHPKADTLYILDIDLKTEKRQIVAGLKKHYEKEILKGKHIIVCTNIKPAKIRGIESNGMLLAAEDGINVALLEAPKSAPGTPVTVEGYDSSDREITFEDFTKLDIRVVNKKVVWENSHFHTEKEDIEVENVQNNARIG